MNNLLQKTKIIRYIRNASQLLGILLTAIGFFTDYPLSNTILIGAIFVIGPVFCGWICPFGTLQEIMGKVGKRFGINKYPIPKKLKKVLVFFRYVLLLVSILISTDLIFSILSLDPRANLTNFLGGRAVAATGWIVIFVFLMISIFYDRPFCNYVCIEGAKFGLMSAARPITILRNEETCVSCGKCNKVCPMNVDVASHDEVRSLQCINCMECVIACPVENTLKIGPVPLKKMQDRGKWIIASAALLFIVFSNLNSTLRINESDSDNFVVVSEVIEEGVSVNETMSEKETVTMDGILSDTEKEIIGEVYVEYGDAQGIADGIYEGTGEGFRGAMTVEINVENQQIIDVYVTKTNDDAKWFNRAYSTIVSNIIANQTANVEVVSGATYSSVGIIEGVANALIDAGGDDVDDIINDTTEKDEHNQ